MLPLYQNWSSKMKPQRSRSKLKARLLNTVSDIKSNKPVLQQILARLI